MGEALRGAGVNLKSFNGLWCYPGLKHEPRHILRAEELANWMASQPVLFGTPDIYKKVTYKDFIKKKGVIFIKDGWGAAITSTSGTAHISKAEIHHGSHGKRGLVLGASIIGLCCLLWSIGSLYPLWGADDRLDEVMIADQRLVLAEADGECVLKVLPDNYSLGLDVGLPCYFQRMDGTLPVESFPELSVDHIFAVIGTCQVPSDYIPMRSYPFGASERGIMAACGRGSGRKREDSRGVGW